MRQTRRSFLQLAAVGTAGTAMGKTAGDALRDRPNVLFVFADQWRRDAVGFAGRDPVSTPNIDAFARSSFRTCNAVSGCPLCSPFRAALMSGRFPDETGMTANCTSNTGQLHLDEGERCIAECFASSGYQTAYIGKWHLDMPSANKVPRPDDGAVGWDAYTPPGPGRQGWEWWYAYNASDEHLTPHYWGRSEKRIEHTGWSVEHETDVAIDWLKNIRRRNRPFAMMVSWNPPHPPYHLVPNELKAEYPDPDVFARRPNFEELVVGSSAHQTLRKKLDYLGYSSFRDMAQAYCAAVAGIDVQFQRLLDVLKDEGLDDNTIVVLTADHGDMMGSHGLQGKTVFWEEATGIPFMLRWPQRIAPRSDTLLINAWDMMPTLLGLAGIPVPETVSGTDLSGCVRGGAAGRPNSTYMRQPCGPQYREQGGGWRAVRTERYSLLSPNGRKQDVRLYDLQRDPYQMNPVCWGQGQDGLIDMLYDELKCWLKKAGDPAVQHYS